MTDKTPETRAGQWLVERARWDIGMRMRRHVLAIEAEAAEQRVAVLAEAMDNLDEVALIYSPKPIEKWTELPLAVRNFIGTVRTLLDKETTDD